MNPMNCKIDIEKCCNCAANSLIALHKEPFHHILTVSKIGRNIVQAG